MEFLANAQRKKMTPTDVVESLSLSGTNVEKVSQKLIAIRVWLATSEGQNYLAETQKDSMSESNSYWQEESGEVQFPCNDFWD